MVRGIHHLNFLVRDLEAAIPAWERALGLPVAARDELPGRGAIAARFRVGATWLVLVQPTDPDGAPGRHLAAHGEGFFLLSLDVPSLADAFAGPGAPEPSGPERAGAERWRVRDLDPQATAGVQLQFCEDPESR